MSPMTETADDVHGTGTFRVGMRNALVAYLWFLAMR